MKRSLLLGALATIVIAVAVAVPTLAHRREEARRNWRDLPQSQRELRVPSAQSLDARFPNGARRVLEGSPQLTLLSVDPSEDFFNEAKSTFHKHGILGETVITDPAAKAALLASFYDGFVAPPDPRGLKQIGIGCFNPRHAIRATLNGKTVDLLICFGCMKFQTFTNDRRVEGYQGINAAPADKFDAVLMAAGVPLSQR